MKKIYFLLFFLTFLAESGFSQTVWFENFDSYADGTTTGSAGSSWTAICGGCIDSGDFFEVRSGRIEGQDVNDFSTWQTQSIDISAHSSVMFSLDAIETGDHEGPSCACGINIDYFDVSYSVDGGAFTVIENWNGDGEAGHTLTGDSQGGVATDADWGSTTITQTGISGSTLVIRVVIRNTSSSEHMFIDNVIVEAEAPLPVIFDAFEGKSTEFGNVLSWSTLNELNSSYFEIEQSLDGKQFDAIDQVEASGTSNTETSYSYLDVNPQKALIYYRLKQVDVDGNFSFSKVIEVNSGKYSENQVYPNPFESKLFVELEANSSVVFSTIDGAMVKKVQLSAGKHNIFDLLENFPSGIIFVNINNQNSNQAIKIQKIYR